MKRAWIVLCLILAAALLSLGRSAASLPEDLQPARPITVFLLRHAETAASTQSERDPPLSEAGAARAAALARLLGQAGVTHLFASEYQRTQATLAPLAEVAGRSVEVVPAADEAQFAGMLRGLAPGSVAVVAGHSNTVPALVLSLGGEVRGARAEPSPPALAHDSYDRLFQVTLAADPGALPGCIELCYGD
jgi:phosphohistidine phosphatase SixA